MSWILSYVFPGNCEKIIFETTDMNMKEFVGKISLDRTKEDIVSYIRISMTNNVLLSFRLHVIVMSSILRYVVVDGRLA